MATSNPTASTRIWYQSFIDPQEQRPYMKRLQQRFGVVLPVSLCRQRDVES